MPLTFAHPAAVLPLFRAPFVPAALVAGAMSPDLPYFLSATGTAVTAQSWYEPFFNATTSHSPLGALTVSLPAALLVYLGMVAAAPPAATVLREGAVPAPARERPSPTRFAVRAGWVLVSLLIGVATHLVWDSITHGWVALNVTALREPLVGSLSAARVLQHVSSALGLAIIAWFVWRRRARLMPEHGTAARTRLLGAVAIASAAGLVGAAVTLVFRWEAVMPLEYFLSVAVTGAGLGATAAGGAMIAGWWLLRLRRDQQEELGRR